MAKKIEYYEDFLKVAETRERILKESVAQRLVLVSSLFLLYVISVFILLGHFSNFTFFSKDTSKNSIEDLQGQINNLDKQIVNISSGNQNVGFQYLNSKITEIEQKNSNLYSTILSNADTAITPKLLNEEQKNLNEKFDDLKGRVDSTNKLLTGILVTILLGVGAYVGKLIWAALFPKLKE